MRQVGLVLPEELLKQLRELAAKRMIAENRRVTVSGIVRRAVAQYLIENPK